MMDAFKIFFDYVGVFFIIYMIGYASFLFLSVTVGSSTLYQVKRRNQLKNELLGKYYVPAWAQNMPAGAFSLYARP